MSFPRILASPLAGTLAVIAGLCLMAVPLHRLTSGTPVAMAKPVIAGGSHTETPAVLRLRLLAPAKRVVIKTMDGRVLLDLADQPAGESEHDGMLRLEGDAVELGIQVDFGEAAAESAVFLTVMPDAYEERTGFGIGRGHLEETLRFVWHQH
jgi:hypothetical protein